MSSKSALRSPTKIEVLEGKPETTEDLVVLAVEKGGLEEVVQLLRDWCGREKVRIAVSNLTARDPVDRFMHARRHAVEIYAKQHGLTPATLMVEIVGRGGRDDAEGAERYKLRKAREFLKEDEIALAGAKALASNWENNRAGGIDHGAYLKKTTEGFTFP
jgi:hypothetical protein